MTNFSKVKHLSKNDIIKNGSIFTPLHITKLVFNNLKKYIFSTDIIMDFGSGYGSFINEFSHLDNKIIATDSDKVSCQYLKKNFFNIKIYNENSLLNVNREKYKIKKTDEIVIIGNPPYNDITSMYKKNKKGEIICDDDIKSRDYGMSFLKMYNKLNPKYICVLHPLSYLIKKTNFSSLKEFKNNYKLIKGIIFSSKEFDSLKKFKVEFPVIMGLYVRDDDGMDYNYISNFSFDVLNSNKKFVLNNIKTIDGIINKLPQKNKINNGLQFYTLRDMNALKRNKTFLDKDIKNGIYVSISDLYKYAWLDVLKRCFNPINNAYIYGNLSPFLTDKLDDFNFKRKLVTYIYETNSIIKQFYKKDILEQEYGLFDYNYDDIIKEVDKFKFMD